MISKKQAVQKLLNQEIVSYVRQSIIPKYTAFDDAHNLDHVNKVIQNSMEIAADYDVDGNKVYVIAAYHDVGLEKGPKDHEKYSASFLLADTRLSEWFSRDELTLMAGAIEDHRASNGHEPRSIYGKIVSEADRDIDYTTVLVRTAQYGLKYFPDLNIEDQFNRCYEHICEKYGEGGYLKLWLDTEKNRRSLGEIRRMLTCKEEFKADFERIFRELTK